MVLYLLRTFFFNFRRPEQADLAAAERGKSVDLAPREERRAEAEAEALAS
jgi:hypothetical protein